MKRLTTPQDILQQCNQWRETGQTIALVPTMGALHDGHGALVDEAVARADKAVVSIFINPLQFNKEHDLQSYPQTLDADLERLNRAGVSLVWTPTRSDMYPDNNGTTLSAGALGKIYEGAHRPGHLDGMLTIVLKLLAAVRPTWALFGEKDFQQLALVRQLVEDYYLPTEIVPMPIIRESDGLAMSSRNAKLTPESRILARALYETLMTIQDAAQAGIRDFTPILQSATDRLRGLKGFSLDYASLINPTTFQETHVLEDQLRFIIAGEFENAGLPVRLIDNGPVVRLSDPTIPKQYT